MKILMINSVCGIRSTGRIYTDIAAVLEGEGHEVKIAYGRETVPEQFQKYAVRIGTDTGVKLHALKARLFDAAGFGSKRATKRFIEWVKEYDPDVIHLHNIHGYYIHIGVLFDYLHNCGKKIIWTLHDCWAFTGHCCYFDFVNCDQWKNGCRDCPQKKEYPASVMFDCAKSNYEKKKRMFCNIPRLTLVTPSKWLAELVSQSNLSEYPVQVIHNGVDTSVFKPTDDAILNKYHLPEKKIVLGVSSVWDRRKGLPFFVELANLLPKEYQIVLVGLTAEQCQELPSNIIGIERTNSATELAALYTRAAVFVNPTLEDNYPTTNLESIACGTPVVTFQTGGSPESAGKLAWVTEAKDATALAKEILCATASPTHFVCEEVDKRFMAKEYLRMY